MKLNANALALASAAAVALVWVVCSLIVILIPGIAMNMSGYMMHSDFGNMQWTMNLTGFVGGLVIWSVFSGVLAWFIATIYNKLSV
jgi:hypothetical protein